MTGQLAGADPVEVAHYRRFDLLKDFLQSIMMICRYQYYNRLQNQTGVNLDLLVRWQIITL